MKRASQAVLALLLGVLAWSIGFEPGWLQQRQLRLAAPGWTGPPLTIAVAADFHVGAPHAGLPLLRRVVREINAARPDIILLPGDFEKYERFSRWMFSYAYDFTPDVEICSIDEGYFDLTAARRPAVEIAATIRDTIRQTLKISVSDNDGNSTDAGGLSQFAFDPAATAGSGRNLTQTVSAQDAKFKLDGLSLTSSTNLVGSAVSGLTLNLRTVTSSPVTVDIARDDSAAAKAVSGLVDAYNEVVSAVKSASSFDSESKKGGPLIGDASVLSVMGRLRGLMTSSIAGLGGVSSLKAVGVSFQKDGTLSFDSSTLADALSSNADSVARLFGATGKASDSRVSVVVSSSTTKTGNYAVDITTEPAGGLLTGAVTAPGFPLTIDGTNNGLSLLIDGTATGALTLTQGSYASADDLAHELQSRINGASALKTAGAAVTVSWNTDHFEIRSNRYGAASTVSLASGSAATALGLDTGTATAGTDVAGTIGGVAATGSGRILTASGDADGLRLLISGAGTGARGSVDFKRGLGDQLKSLLDDVLADDGTIGRRSSGLSDESARIAKQRTALDDRMTELETRYRTQFTRLDSVMASLKATSDFLTSQLNAMTNSGSSSSSSN